jgi:hypothetical protein
MHNCILSHVKTNASTSKTPVGILRYDVLLMNLKKKSSAPWKTMTMTVEVGTTEIFK